MATRSSPTARGRRLRYELRRIREEKGLTIEQTATNSDGAWNPSTISRWESGERIPRPADLRVLLDVYGIRGTQRDALVELGKQARQKGWWHPDRDVLKSGFGVYIGLEAEARTVRTYQTLLLPGLLQTEDYARTIIRTVNKTAAPEEIDRLVALRMNRQHLLAQDTPVHLWAILDEGLLRHPVGEQTLMHTQLDRLLDEAQRPNVTLQILPRTCGAHPGMEGPFFLIEFPDPHDPGAVYLEQPTSGLVVEEESQIARYTLIFGQLTSLALDPDPTTDLIRDIRSEYT